MTDQQRAVGGRRLRLKRLNVRCKLSKPKPITAVIEQIERRCHARRKRLRRWRKRNTAVPRHHRGDTLADLGRHRSIGQQQPVVVCVNIDETWRSHAPTQVNLMAARGVSKITDLLDAISANTDIRGKAGRAGAINHLSVSDQQIKANTHGRFLKEVRHARQSAKPLRPDRHESRSARRRDSPWDRNARESA